MYYYTILITEVDDIKKEIKKQSDPFTIDRLNINLSLLRLDNNIKLKRKIKETNKYDIYVCEIDKNIDLNLSFFNKSNNYYLKKSYEIHFNTVVNNTNLSEKNLNSNESFYISA